MKLLLLFLLIVSTPSRAEAAGHLRTQIIDDGDNLSIQIDGNAHGRSVHLDTSFSVAELSPLRKELLTYRAFQSADVTPPLRDLPWLMGTTLGMTLGGLVLLTFVLRRIKSVWMNPVQSPGAS